MYNERNEIIEWYFDIAKKIGKENGIPYEDDLYLDILVRTDGDVILLDEEELIDALKRKEITKKDFDEANKLANDLMNKVKGKEKELKQFTDRYLEMML